jgi:hypothetical protein
MIDIIMWYSLIGAVVYVYKLNLLIDKRKQSSLQTITREQILFSILCGPIAWIALAHRAYLYNT